MSELEFDKVLVLSTVHISKEDSSRLSHRDHSLITYELDEYGWLIYVRKTDPRITQMTKEFSEGFQQAVKLAQENNCTYLRLDRDANTFEGLPTYEW